MEAIADISKCTDAQLIAAMVWPVLCRRPVETFNLGKIDTMLGEIVRAFCLVPLEVHTSPRPRYSAGFDPRVRSQAISLSSCVSTPLRRMMKYCWISERTLFHTQ